MGGLFSSPEPAAPVALPPTPTQSDADVQAAGLNARRRRAAASGRESTIHTSGQGVTTDLPSATSTLLGE